MIQTKSPRTLKLILPVIALILLSVMLFAFKSANKTNKVHKVFSTLTFKYQQSSYTAPMVASQSNWSLVDPGEACAQEDDDAACSFSINVPTGNESLYLNGSQPSSRVIIEAAQSSSSSNHYVSALKENVSGTPPISGSISNIIP